MRSIIEELTSTLGAEKIALDTTTLAAYAVDQAPSWTISSRRPWSSPNPWPTCRQPCVPAPPAASRLWRAGPVPGSPGAPTRARAAWCSRLERMNRILDLNPDDETAVVEPGVINADLNAAAAVHGLMYAPDPASFKMSTIGGNVATNAGGLRCAKYGVTRDSVLALDVVPRGRLPHPYRPPDLQGRRRL